MAAASKSRKFLLHLKLSKRENFLHDHELYEMMRSRQLYNVHNDLRKKLGRTIRGIQDAERVHVANIESQRILFLQRAARKAKARLRLTSVNEKSPQYSPAVNKGGYSVDNASHRDPGMADVLNPHEYRSTTIYHSKMKKLSCEMSYAMNHPDKIHEQRFSTKGTRSSQPELHERESVSCNIRGPTKVYESKDTVHELCKFQLMRSSRLQTIREYTQLLDKRVREFRCAYITDIQRTANLLK